MAGNRVVKPPATVLHNRRSTVLATHRADPQMEQICHRCSKGPFGQPSLPPGDYSRIVTNRPFFGTQP